MLYKQLNPIQAGLWKLVERPGGAQSNHLHTSAVKNGHSMAQNGFKNYMDESMVHCCNFKNKIKSLAPRDPI